MTITKITDKYNPHKVWVIKHYPCGHFYINQEISNRLFYKAFQRATKEFINSVFD